MAATAMVGSDDVCSASLRPYLEGQGDHQHQFTDPDREGALPAGWATLHPTPTVDAVPYTDALPGGHEGES